MKIIAFYLPQYHQIPENDLWWGKGFTDWVNVKKARSLFKGHHQPHIPIDLGYYDLRDDDIRKRQADTARRYGVDGFCYYHYWFNDKMLLEYPFDRVLETGEPDFPFCLCWANENWCRRWEGRDTETLITQDDRKYNYSNHFAWLVKAFKDKRYITVNGKPIFLIYDPSSITNISTIVNQWRKMALESGLPGIFVCSVNSHKNRYQYEKALSLGFDATVEFHPHKMFWPRREFKYLIVYFIPRIINRITRLFKIHINNDLTNRVIINYVKYVKNTIKKTKNIERGIVFPTLFPSWDNTSRRKNTPLIIQNDDPEAFGTWLKYSMDRTSKYEEDTKIVFINAWNEWAEGCHLEPDERNGYKFLEAVASIKKVD